MKSISGAMSTNCTRRSWCLFHRNSTHLLCMDLCDALDLLDIFSVMELNQNFLFMGKDTVAENLWLTPKQTRIFSSTYWCFAFFLLGCNLGEFRVAQKGLPYNLMYQSPALQKEKQYFSECLLNCLVYIMGEVYWFSKDNVALCLPS